MNSPPEQPPDTQPSPDVRVPSGAPVPAVRPEREIGGRDGPEPTRFGDWEKAGRCIDF